MKLKCYCTDNSVVVLDFNIELYCNNVANYRKSVMELMWQFAERHCNKWDDKGFEKIKSVTRVMFMDNSGIWGEIDQENKYPAYGVYYGVYYGTEFINGCFYEGDYVLIDGNNVHDDLWFEDKGWVPASSEKIEDILPFKDENLWIGHVVNGEMVRVDDE